MTIPNMQTPSDLVEEAVRILQRGLPGGELDDKGVVIELWGLLDTPDARAIYRSDVPEFEIVEAANDDEAYARRRDDGSIIVVSKITEAFRGFEDIGSLGGHPSMEGEWVVRAYWRDATPEEVRILESEAAQ